MSHFTQIKTQMVEREYLLKALADLGLTCTTGNVEAKGYAGQRTPVEICLPTRDPDYDIGFRQTGQMYEMVADWDRIKDFNRDKLLRQVTQRYAYHAAKAKLAEQGFALASEEVQKDGRIHLVLRRAT